MKMTAEQKMARNLSKARFYVGNALTCRQNEQYEYMRNSGSSEPIYDALLNMRQRLSELIDQFGGSAYKRAPAAGLSRRAERGQNADDGIAES